MTKFIAGKAIAKGIEGAIIAGLAGAGGMAAVEHSANINMTNPEEAVTTVSLMVFGFLFRYLRNWIKQKRAERKSRG